MVNPHYYAAFTWALLDSIADTTSHPPKLRPLREISCITKLDNEAVSRVVCVDVYVYDLYARK
ncbi:hypothetical protein EON65_28775 [archaeon]|nr:MAG: hypothetical protein EON65_28775 [archaeon]